MKITTRSATSRSLVVFALSRALALLCITQRNAGQRVLGASALGLASLLGPSQSDAAILVANTPELSANNVVLNVSATNNNEGAVWNSAELNVVKDLASQLFALPENQNLYSSIEDLMSGWGFLVDPTGDVSSGWNATKENDGSISILNNQIPFGYDVWNSNPGSNTQLYTITIPKSQLDFTGVAGYDPEKAGIVLSSETRANMFVGFGADGFSNWPTEGQFYQVQIPEPSSYAALFGCLAAFVALYRRRNRKS